ncbi:MAG: hypothetical protein QGG48_05255 [Desulfatiglandales bacterium]|nr:hypothetical protein [Desulfatiglandales bacterium]
MPLLEEKDEPFSLKHPDVQSFFSKRQLGRVLIGFGFQKEKTEHLNWALLSVLSDGGWVRNKKLKKILYNPLVKIAYHYISKEKNPGTNP